MCEGTPNVGAACEDYNDCTSESVCVKSSFGNSAFCQGTKITVGAKCDDYDACTADDKCVEEEYDYGPGGTAPAFHLYIPRDPTIVQFLGVFFSLCFPILSTCHCNEFAICSWVNEHSLSY